MAFNMEQIQRQEQRLLLTPRMQQAIRLLQLPLARLEATIRNELDQNPVLEMVQQTPEEGDSPEGDAPEEQSGLEDFREEFERILERERDLDEQYRRTAKYRRDQALDDETREYWENSLTSPETLDEHLLHQLQMTELSPGETRVGEEIIGELDGNGYLGTTVEELAERLEVEVAVVERVLAVIQHFDPPGVGARDLRECLLVQLDYRRPANRLVRLIVSEHLEELARKDYSGIARRLGTDPESVRQAAEYIAGLEPNPGRNFSSPTAEYITPEIHVVKEDGRFQVLFDHDTLPEVRISRNYRDMIEKGNLDEETRKYIRERIHSGEWLIENIRQRRETLQLLAEEIVQRQQDFLEHGPLHLKPLKMSEVAEAIGRHESTVSRAASGKYVSTPRGVFPLRFFFSGSLSGRTGQDLSPVSVQEKIKKLIEAEQPAHPLSDQDIARTLAEEGIEIARRTVAKYREGMGIPSTRMRRVR